jgi:Secretion system C-terminal sorting domain
MLLCIVVCFTLQSVAVSQIILFQDFNNGTNPGWITSNGASVGSYNDATNACAPEFGIITPGVGGNNPAKVLSEVVTPNQSIIEVRFSINRYDANLSCASHSDFACATSVDIIAVPSTYTGNDPLGDLPGTSIYSNNSGFLLPITGGNVSLNMTLPNATTPFKVFFNFTVAGNCNQPGTKYVLDKFSFTGVSPCAVTNTCPPVANDDYFKAEDQGFLTSTLLGNIFGTNLAYTPGGAHTINVTRSLTNGILSPLGGNDFDVDNHAQNLMGWTLLTQDFTAAEATFTFNTDGTFSFNRINTARDLYHFTYRITDPTALFDDATVTIDYRTATTVPVKLVYFMASKTPGGAKLVWETAQEQNNQGFEVERKTTGGYQVISNIPSQAPGGNSSTPLAYQLTDNSRQTTAISYYRLKQTDINGKTSYSEVRTVRNDKTKPALEIYPNPSRGIVNIVLPADAGVADIILSDMRGNRVQHIKGTADRKIIFTNLQAGTYTVRVINKLTGDEYSDKLIVK